MNDNIKHRIAQIYELVERGATKGERKAARAALDRLMVKYKLEESDLVSINKTWRVFKYTTRLELLLLTRLGMFMIDLDINNDAYRTSIDPKSLTRCKQVMLNLTYLDYIALEASYEYFRRHMKGQWQKTCEPIVRRCIKAKTRNKKRRELQETFFDQYIIASGLVEAENLVPLDPSSMSRGELDRLRALQGLEGGRYNTQVTGGRLLNQSNAS